MQEYQNELKKKHLSLLQLEVYKKNMHTPKISIKIAAK